MLSTQKTQYIQWLFLLLIIIVGPFIKLQANSPYTEYSVVDGMANSTIKAISEDTMGYIWFGTRNGLIRFDGYEFRNYIYETEKKNTIYSNDITCITRDNRGWLWIGTFNWILLFNPFSEKFVELELEYPDNKLPEGVVTNIWIDRSERIWISSKTGLYLLEENKVKAIKELEGAYINAMDACDWESLIMEVTGKGTAIYNIRHNKLEYVDETNIGARPVFYKIFRDSKGQVWLGADKNNLFTYRPQNRRLEKVKMEVPEGTKFDNDQIHDILEYNDSILIVGTDNGLVALNCYTHIYSESSMRLLQASLLKNNRIMCLHRDHQDGFWVGTFGKGVKYYNPKHYYFNYYDLRTEDNLPLNIAGKIAEKDGFLYIGHQQGLTRMNMKTGEDSPIDLQKLLKTPNEKPELFYLYQKNSDIIYFHLLNWGLHAFDLNQSKITERLAIAPTSQVRSMTKDKNGHIWIAEEEISVYDPITKNIDNNLSTNVNNITNFMLVQDIILCKNGDILVGTRTSGVWIYPWNEKTKKYEEAIQPGIEQLKNKNINILFEDSKGNIWLGTYSSGLYKCNFQTNQWSLYNTASGLVHNSIYDILEDEKSGEIWIAALNGISRIDPVTEKILNYTNKTGFPLQEIPRKAFYKGSNGLFYIGGNNGLVSFNPRSFQKSPTNSSSVKISLIESINKKVGVETPRFDNSNDLQNVEFPFKHSSILINFSALNYFFPQGIKYSYKLDGLEHEWRYTERNEVIYSNLSEGTYTFLVRASDSEGTWSDKITELKFTIHPPLWRTPWAKFIYSLLILGLLYFILTYFNNRKTMKYKQQINRIEKENLEKYYQMKLELFTKFSHELRTPLTLITGPTEDLLKDDTMPEKLSYPLRLIHKNASRLLLLVNQLMDFRKIEHGSMRLKISKVNVQDFLAEQVESFLQLANKRGIKLSYINEFKEEDVWFDISLMEKVIFNLLSNAIKHTSPGGEIRMFSRKEENKLVISVRDNGEGISEENLEKIFGPFFQVQQGDRSGIFGSGIGLNLAQYVVSLHTGIIRVESKLGEGSEFFVQLPLGKNHFLENPEQFIVSEPQTEANKIETAKVPQISLEKSIINQLEAEVPESFSSTSNKIWILVAEDDEDLRHYIVNILSDEYGIIQAEDGKNGLSLATEKIPDLIISDIQMPLMNGIEFCKQVKEDMRTAHIPVILLTALTRNDNIREGYEAMADDYILKPFDSELLRVRVKNLLDNRNQLREIFSKELISLDIPAANLNLQDQFMEKLMELIKSRAEDPELSINELCMEMGVSRAQLFRKIKAVSDVSPNKLILNVRMKMAVTYLKTKQFTVTEVAYKVGFSDPTYFSKTFKSVFNITPTEFMKGV